MKNTEFFMLFFKVLFTEFVPFFKVLQAEFVTFFKKIDFYTIITKNVIVTLRKSKTVGMTEKMSYT